MNCVAVSYMSGFGNPYYVQNYAWSGGYTGMGPAMFCDPAFGSNQCGYSGAVCYPAGNGTRHGICR